MNRPTGVSVIAIFFFVATVCCALFGIGVIAGGGFVATMMNRGGQGGPMAAGMMAGLGAVLGVFILVIGAVYAVLGWGLWTLKDWARLVTIVLTGLGAVLSLPGFLRTLIHFSLGGFVWSAFWLAVDIVIIWYLLKPEVKAVFQGSQARSASA